MYIEVKIEVKRVENRSENKILFSAIIFIIYVYSLLGVMYKILFSAIIFVIYVYSLLGEMLKIFDFEEYGWVRVSGVLKINNSNYIIINLLAKLCLRGTTFAERFEMTLKSVLWYDLLSVV